MSTVPVRDPVRLIADASVPNAARDLLRQGVDIAPPAGAEARVWQGLAGALGAAAIGGAAGTAADASTKTTIATAGTNTTAAGLTGAKIVALVVTLASAVAVGGYLLMPGSGPRPPASSAAPVAPAPPTAAEQEPPPAAGAPPSEDTPAPAESAEVPPAPRPHKTAHAQPRPAAGPAGPPPTSAGRLREETTLIREARQALRQGDAARALKLLDECRRLFPRGVLEQERERLAIEALSRSGRAAEASARAASFLRKYPDSPHAGEIRGLGLGPK